MYQKGSGGQCVRGNGRQPLQRLLLLVKIGVGARVTALKCVALGPGSVPVRANGVGLRTCKQGQQAGSNQHQMSEENAAGGVWRPLGVPFALDNTLGVRTHWASAGPDWAQTGPGPKQAENGPSLPETVPDRPGARLAGSQNRTTREAAGCLFTVCRPFPPATGRSSDLAKPGPRVGSHSI